jgi:integrase
MSLSQTHVNLPGQPIEEQATTNRRERSVALDEFTLSMLRAQVEMQEERARSLGVKLIDDAYVFSDAPDGSEPWRPGAITRYFARLRERVGLEHLDFHYLRKFMETYGQDLGFSPVQVAMRAGHDPQLRRSTTRAASRKPTEPCPSPSPRCS